MELSANDNRFFQESHIPEGARLVGLAALTEQFGVKAPVRRASAVSERHIKGGTRQLPNWTVFDKRYMPEDTIAGHLLFALKHDRLDLLVLKRIFQAIPEPVMLEVVREGVQRPAQRRLWFFYEFLTGGKLDIPDLTGSLSLADALDAEQFFVRTDGEVSRRHKVRNNLLGTSQLCPVVRRTQNLQSFSEMQLGWHSQKLINRVSNELIARAANFFLLADTKSSFAIEGETPPRTRLERWARAVQQSGRHSLTVAEIERLYNILIEDRRFTPPGLRTEMVFLGERHRDEPLPEFIPAKPDDIRSLLDGLVSSNNLMSEAAIDPVIQATAVAFGFVYIHPLADGNGRLHRCLIHHVLAERQFTPPDIVFPISSVIARREQAYRSVLRAHSGPLMPYIQWKPNLKGNVDVLNETADLYAYFDCTEEAEFLYSCVQEAVEVEVPREIDYLRRYDQAKTRMMNIVEMPDRTAEDFIQFMRQNEWKLPNRRRKDEFALLTDEEVRDLETAVTMAFDGYVESK